MKEIKRYEKDDKYTVEDSIYYVEIVEARSGQYVKYTDHKAVVETKDRLLKDKVDSLAGAIMEIQSLKDKIEEMKCCNNCRNNVAGSNKCIKDVFSIICYYKDPIKGEKGYWESDSEGVING